MSEITAKQLLLQLLSIFLLRTISCHSSRSAFAECCCHYSLRIHSLTHPLRISQLAHSLSLTNSRTHELTNSRTHSRTHPPTRLTLLRSDARQGARSTQGRFAVSLIVGNNVTAFVLIDALRGVSSSRELRFCPPWLLRRHSSLSTLRARNRPVSGTPCSVAQSFTLWLLSGHSLSTLRSYSWTAISCGGRRLDWLRCSL